MFNLNNNNIEFNEEKHSYLYEGVSFLGITQMISEMLFPNKIEDMAKIPTHILDNATTKGKDIHKEIELVDSLGVYTDNPSVLAYLEKKIELGITTIANEYLVTDYKNFATAIDSVIKSLDNPEEVDLIDFKNTYALDTDFVSWQLSVGAYFFELNNPHIKVNKLFAWHLKTMNIVEVVRKSNEQVVKLCNCYLQGEPFINDYSLVSLENDIEVFVSDYKEYKQAKELVKEFEDKEKIFKEKLIEIMKIKGIKKETLDINISEDEIIKLSITYKLPYYKKSIDSDKLKLLYPKIYDEVVKETLIKDSVLITYK